MTRAIHRNSSPRGAVANCGVLVGFLFLFLIIVGLTHREETVRRCVPTSPLRYLLSSRSRPLLPFPERATANLVIGPSVITLRDNSRQTFGKDRKDDDLRLNDDEINFTTSS